MLKNVYRSGPDGYFFPIVIQVIRRSPCRAESKSRTSNNHRENPPFLESLIQIEKKNCRVSGSEGIWEEIEPFGAEGGGAVEERVEGRHRQYRRLR
jgi:hypothetical protein